MTNAMSITDVLGAVDREIEYQDKKWGADKEQSLAGYLMIMKKEIDAAIHGWMHDSTGRNSPLSEVLQTVTVGLRCLQAYGVEGSTRSTNDIVPAREPDAPKTITLTTAFERSVVIGVAMIIDVFPYEPDVAGNGSLIRTNTGTIFVQEDVETIQRMMAA